MIDNDYCFFNPYKGLLPYEATDSLFFFGREKQQESILARLFSWRLTIVYGDSGVGKSSILRASVAYHLRQIAWQNVEKYGKPKLSVIVLSLDDQSSREPLTRLKQAIKKQIEAQLKEQTVQQIPPELSFVKTLQKWTEVLQKEKGCGRLFIILDQFENCLDYLLNKQRNDQKGKETFKDALSAAINDPSLNVNFLFSIRKDALAKLDYFKGSIRDLLDNRLEIKSLDKPSAIEAITKPIEEYNRQHIILDHLLNSQLTILYGDSDAYSKTLLQDDIAHYLHKSKLAYFLFKGCSQNESLWQLLEKLSEKRKEKLFLILDQFEKYFWNQPEIAKKLLQKILNVITECPNVNFLISLKTQWLVDNKQFQWFSEFELFNNKILDSSKYLYLFKDKEGIDRIAEGIVNHDDLEPFTKFKIEEQLINDVLEGIESEPEYFDTSTLQLLMTYLWQEETQNLDNLEKDDTYTLTLRTETYRKFMNKNSFIVIFVISLFIKSRLHQLGLLVLKSDNWLKLAKWSKLAAKNIVRDHVYNNLKKKKLSPSELATASRLLYYLITPSGIRFTQKVQDLIDYANNSRFIDESELTQETVVSLLEELSKEDFPVVKRILGDRYEIFRPVLSEAILNWVQVDRQIKHLKEKAKDALKQFETSQLESLVQAMKIGKKLAEIKNKDQSLFTELLGDVPPIINLALQKILDNIREKNQFLIKPRSSSYYGFCFSHDGQKLASGSLDGKVSLLNLQGNLLEKPFPVSSGPVFCVSFSPDSQQLVTTSWESKVYLWSLKGEKITTLRHKETDRIYFASFNPSNGEQLVTTSENGIAYLWDLQQPEKPLKQFPHHGEPVYYASFSPDGRKLATIVWKRSDASSIVYLWDVDSSKGGMLPSPARQVYRVKFSPDGKLLIIASLEGKAYLHDLEVPDKKPIEFPHKGPVYFADFKKSSFNIRLWTLLLDLDHLIGMLFWEKCLGWEVVSASWDGTIRFWDLKGEERAKLMINKEPAYRASLSLNGQQFTNITWDGVAHLWDLGACASNLKDKSLKIGSCKHKAVVFRISFSPDGKYLVSASTDEKVRLWDLQQKEKPQLLKDFSVEKKPKPIYYVSFSPDGNYLAIASDNQEILLYDLRDLHKPWKTLTGHQKRVYSLSFSSDGKYLASASEDKKVLLWDWQQDKKIIEPVSVNLKEEHKGSIYYACFSPNGRYLASASADGTARLWDIQQPNPEESIREFKGHFGFVYCVNFSPDGEKLATASQDGTVRLWNLQGEELGQCMGHEAAVFWVTFSPDGEKLATASQDGTVRLWKLQENLQGKLQGKPIAIFKDHEDKQPIYCAIFSPDGKWLATASGDCTVKIRQLENVKDFEKILFRGCHWLRDYLETDLKTDPDPDINKDKKELAAFCEALKQ